MSAGYWILISALFIGTAIGFHFGVRGAVRFVVDALAPATDSGKGFLYRSVRKTEQMEAEVYRLEDELAQAKKRLAELQRA